MTSFCKARAASWISRVWRSSRPFSTSGISGVQSDDSKHRVQLIYTAASIGDSVIRMVRAAKQTPLVLTDEPTAIDEAYAMDKLPNREYGMAQFRVLGKSLYPHDGRVVFTTLEPHD